MEMVRKLRGVKKVSTDPKEEREGKLKVGGSYKQPIKLEKHNAPKQKMKKK